MKRGEIWTASGGADYAGKSRPVLIVQDDAFDATASITICGLTSNALDVELVRPVISPTSSNGLQLVSRVMVDKVTTVHRSKLDRLIGVLTSAEMAEVNVAIIVFLGIANRAAKNLR